MILYFAAGKYTNTLKTLMKQWVPELQQTVRPMNYETLSALRRIPKATYIFTDHERMSPEMLRMACAFADQLRPHGRVLNEPSRVLTRHALLKELHDRGWNDFRAFRIHEVPHDLRFPVFVRSESDHKGPRTELLTTHRQIEEATLSLIAQGFPLSDLLVIEYMAKEAKYGLFWRYGAHRVGDEIRPQIVTFGTDWRVKGVGMRSPELMREEIDYVRDNPHAEQIWRAFKAANIDYGRMDYSIVDGRLQVYEINTNPLVMWRKQDLSWKRRRALSRPFSKGFAQALLRLDSEANGDFEIDQEAIAQATLQMPSKMVT